MSADMDIMHLVLNASGICFLLYLGFLKPMPKKPKKRKWKECKSCGKFSDVT